MPSLLHSLFAKYVRNQISPFVYFRPIYDALDKVVYLENRRFLPENHPLRRQKKNFPGHKFEKRSPPEDVTIEDVLWDSVAHNRAKNKTQASNVMKATGSRGVNCFMLLPNHDRPNQAFPDLMHDIKNIVCAFFELFIGKGDTVKVRNVERDLGRFEGSWLVAEKQDEFLITLKYLKYSVI